MRRAKPFAMFAAVALLVSACVSRAQFESNGRAYAPVVARAIRCDRESAATLLAAGGEAIGTVDASGASTDTPVDDVLNEAAEVAAKNGATHFVFTGGGANVPPGRRITGRYVAFRVPVEAWARLPAPLRPPTNR